MLDKDSGQKQVMVGNLQTAAQVPLGISFLHSHAVNLSLPPGGAVIDRQ